MKTIFQWWLTGSALALLCGTSGLFTGLIHFVLRIERRADWIDITLWSLVTGGLIAACGWYKDIAVPSFKRLALLEQRSAENVARLNAIQEERDKKERDALKASLNSKEPDVRIADNGHVHITHSDGTKEHWNVQAGTAAQARAGIMRRRGS